MTGFDRHFAHSDLAPSLRDGSLLKRLFAEWRLPGRDAPTTTHGLRLAVRSGYLNFYAKGQSVARLSMVRCGPRLDVHRKYVGDTPGTGTLRGDYVRFEGDALDPAALPSARLDDWMRLAIEKSGAEKRFVDDLVTANPGTIDLEMALPGDDRAPHPETGKRIASRMDLVVLQKRSEGLDLAFWEAKMRGQ